MAGERDGVGGVAMAQRFGDLLPLAGVRWINSETYAIAKADLLLKGEGEAADNIIGGPEYSTLANDAFPSREFDFIRRAVARRVSFVTRPDGWRRAATLGE